MVRTSGFMSWWEGGDGEGVLFWRHRWHCEMTSHHSWHMGARYEGGALVEWAGECFFFLGGGVVLSSMGGGADGFSVHELEFFAVERN